MVYKPKYDYLINDGELRAVIDVHKRNKSIIEVGKTDVPLATIAFLRAENELKHAESVFKISNSNTLKSELDLLEKDTFYSGVITHAYYAIFYAAKALLQKVGVELKSPNIHKAGLDAFAFYYIVNGRLDVELLNIYKSAIVKADSLLELFASEKDKRGTFTYLKLPDANKEPASESIRNATEFLTHAKKILQKK